MTIVNSILFLALGVLVGHLLGRIYIHFRYGREKK